MSNIPKAINDQTLEVQATQSEVDAAVQLFKAALFRGNSKAVADASNMAVASFQRHLDAQAASIALIKQFAGL